MKKNLLHNLAYVLFGLIAAFGISAAAAGTWTEPSAAAPGGNLNVPIHTGPSQVKAAGSCQAGNCGGLSVGTFSVANGAELYEQIFMNGIVRGGTPADTNSQVFFGDSSHVVNATVTGNASAVGALESGSLVGSTDTALCADTSGVIKLCN